MGAIRNLFKRLERSKSGNAAMIVALGMPALIGGAGFAVDTAQWYMWKRELQHAVDQAAIAGAWALTNEDSAANYETRAQQEYAINLSKTAEFADEEPSVSLAGFAGGTDNSVVVTATASKPLPFSSFLTGTAATIRASAQASFAEGGTYSACLVSTAEDGTGTSIGGNAEVHAQCGLAALSCDDDAIEIDGSATVDTQSIVACGTITAPEENEDQVTENVNTLEDIYKDLVPPDNPTPRSYACTGKGKNAQASLLPGTYQGLVVSCTTTFGSGIYVIDGGVLDLAANYNVTGLGVMFVLKNHARIKFGGNGNGNSINMTPMQESDFIGTPYAADADKYAGMLVFEHRDNEPSNPGHQLNGNSNSVMEGIVYLPSGTMTILGTADVTAQCLQISAHRIVIGGNAFLETFCPVDSTMSVGSAAAGVKLIA
jgi:Flp pilus assembly protein TadG